MPTTRPSADLSTTIGVSLVAASLSAAIVIVVWHNPTPAILTGLLAAGGTLIGVLERAPTPSPTPVPVETRGDDIVATREKE